MRRIVMLVVVALVMAAMMVAMGAQAIADTAGAPLPPAPPTQSGSFSPDNNGSTVTHQGGGGTCVQHFKGTEETKTTGPGCD
jgi:opacity protein-like surface antigen